jgi:hypothetical protein
MAMVEKLVAAGGKEWRKGDMHRVYFNDLAQRVGLEYETYKTGNVKWAKINGTYTSNSHARGIINQLTYGKFWWDVPTQKFMARDIDPKYIETITASIMEQVVSEQQEQEPKYFALVHHEIGVLGVGKTRAEAVESYAKYWITENEHEDTLAEQIAVVWEGVNERAYQTEECTEALYLNFLKEGNQTAYDYDSEGFLDLQPDSEA